MIPLKLIIDKAEHQLIDITHNPRREARLLAAHVLGIPYEEIYFDVEGTLGDDEEKLFNTLLQRRLKHEPLSKIIEFREFWSLPFRVTSDTLDPRPDSETLIEAILSYYPNKNDPLRILDLGTGTGCLLLSFLHEYPNAWGVGVDISHAACFIAQENAIRLKLEDRANFLVAEWGNALSSHFDIIISNPPYISSLEALPHEVAGYDPALALYAGKDGLASYRVLAEQIPRMATPKTKIFLELGRGQLEAVRALFSLYTPLQIKQDLSGYDRCFVVRIETMPVE